MAKSLREDFETVSPSRGLFVGQLDEDEFNAFGRLVAAGVAHRSYEGGAGLMGLAKVRFNEVTSNILSLEAQEGE